MPRKGSSSAKESSLAAAGGWRVIVSTHLLSLQGDVNVLKLDSARRCNAL